MTVFSYPQTLFVFELNFLDQALSHCWYLYTTWPMPVLELAERGPYGKNLNKDMWFQLQLHHNTWTRINIHTETFRNAWGEDPSALPCTNTASEVYTSCTPLAGLSLSAAKPHSISLSPRAHSKNNPSMIHFRAFLLKLLHNWAVHVPRWGGFTSRELAAKPSGFSPDCSLWLLLPRWINMGTDLCRDAVPFPFPSTWNLPSIHKTYSGKCRDLVPHRASKLW